jgi:hypothetical protein
VALVVQEVQEVQEEVVVEVVVAISLPRNLHPVLLVVVEVVVVVLPEDQEVLQTAVQEQHLLLVVVALVGLPEVSFPKLLDLGEMVDNLTRLVAAVVQLGVILAGVVVLVEASDHPATPDLLGLEEPLYQEIPTLDGLIQEQLQGNRNDNKI